MADTEAKDSKSREEPKQFSVTIPSYDGSGEVIAELQESKENAAHPPKLINLSTNPLASSKPPTTVPKTYIILSTGSGHRKAESFFQDVLSPILDIVHPGGTKACELHITTSENSILELARDVFLPAANDRQPQRIILASGDGGIVDLVNGMLTQTPLKETYTAPEIVLLPLGTANALYHSLTPGQKNTWGLSSLGSQRSKPLPTFTATFSPGSRVLVDQARAEKPLPLCHRLHGAVVVSWCMHASLVADSDSAPYRRFGIDRFKIATKEALYPATGTPPHAYRGRISILPTASETWENIPLRKHLYTLATMVSHLEPAFCISPRSRALRRAMHLVHFGPMGGDDAMRLMGLAYQGGKHVEDPMVRYVEIQGLRIEFEEEDDRWRRVCVDGKIVRVEEGGWVEVRVDGEMEGLRVVLGRDGS